MKSCIKYLIVAIIIVISGCASTSPDTKNYVNKSLFAQLKFGETTKSQVKEILGEPAYVDNNPDGRSVFMYDTSSTAISGLVFTKDGVLNKIADFEKN
ncbi:Outer membrane protein assembly factor BamE, lipoprotein component of the BamABCDE complex [Ferrimonas sediminum]|uniref:Outer membrane protein assembly factor BamE, lipoprotein component of the BamABCDE complex n=1 Tax=Ferrimonas sediminum TaxID=718193 RepID=A0A1G8WTW9_9GAMM|nr:outer membrane protein assembly factor BamE [Ferrimonas sediminum]SDJ81842.1 Outer membrane protein assembly factor BamE, lipoprotein component of the BamABCDE complex [Ferrimonas sediminum]